MEKKFLIGFTKDYNIIQAEIAIRDWNFENEFTASFSESSIVNADETIYNEDYIYDYVESFLDGMDDEYKYELCEKYDCTPRNLTQKLTDLYLDDPDDFMHFLDNSYYPEIVSTSNSDYFFIAEGGGQHDTRDDLLYAIDKELYDDIHYLWDNYHLKQLDEKGLELFNSVIERASRIDEEEEIKKFIEEYKEEIDEKTW